MAPGRRQTSSQDNLGQARQAMGVRMLGEHQASTLLRDALAVCPQQALGPGQGIGWPIHPDHVLAVDETQPLVGIRVRRQKRLAARQGFEGPHARHVRLLAPIHAATLVVQAEDNTTVSVLLGDRTAARLAAPEALVLGWPHERGVAEERQGIARTPERFHHGLHAPEPGLILIPVGADDEVACRFAEPKRLVESRAACQRQPVYAVVAQSGAIRRNTGCVSSKDSIGLLRLVEERCEGIGILDGPPGEWLLPAQGIGKHLGGTGHKAIHGQENVRLFGLLDKVAARL